MIPIVRQTVFKASRSSMVKLYPGTARTLVKDLLVFINAKKVYCLEALRPDPNLMGNISALGNSVS
jgi:hypothetical protein